MRCVIVFILILFPDLFPCAEVVSSLILARGGSKGVFLKNIQEVGGLSLIARAIKTSKLAGIHDVTVSTDHPLIAFRALKDGASVFRRSRVTANDEAPSIWGAAEFVHLHSSNPRTDILVLLQATSPFTRPEDVKRGVEKLQNSSIDCVFSVTRSHKLRWTEEGKTVLPLNFDLNSRPRRQNWNGELTETGAFYITRKSLIELGAFQNNNHTSEMTQDTGVITYEDLENTDVITVELVPERKGLILKHCEYYVSSRRHGTTVTRRYNEFALLHDILIAKYPYRAIPRLPPKRVVVGGGSPKFLQRRRAALQRWLSLVARHPVLAHDADLRMFLCETSLRLEKPKHDEFTMAGVSCEQNDVSTEEMEASFASEHEQLRLIQLGLGRIYQIFEKVDSSGVSEVNAVRSLGAALSALAADSGYRDRRWAAVSAGMRNAATLTSSHVDAEPYEWEEQECVRRVQLSLCALEGAGRLCARLTRGLHGERAAAAAQPRPSTPAAHALRDRHRYALACALQEASVSRAYALSALSCLPELFHLQAESRANTTALWRALHTALALN